MATWIAEINAAIIANGIEVFPKVSFKTFHVEVVENSVIRLARTVKEEAFQVQDNVIDVEVKSIDRTDKKTGKDYSGYCTEKYPDPLNEPTFGYSLNEKQIEKIKIEKNKIYEKLESKGKIDKLRLPRFEYIIHKLNDQSAFIVQNWVGIISHEDALTVIESILNFYLSLSPEEIHILNIDRGKISFAAYELLRKYFTQTDKEPEEKISKLWHRRKEISESQAKVLGTFLEKQNGVDEKVLQTFLNWISKEENNHRILSALSDFKTSDIGRISSIIGVIELQKLIGIWSSNRLNRDEEFWQNLLEVNSILFSQIFSYPISIIGEKVYVGGKSIYNKSGNVADFLLSNNISDNVMIVEIKTPSTKLMGSKYRGIRNISNELSGSTIQLANYKDSLVKSFARLTEDIPNLRAYNPDCFLIIGDLDQQDLDIVARKSFELYRRGLKDVQVVTFDEVFEKASILLKFLKGEE